jgi:diguanylate cyclase (GGDEF)-like protein
MGGLAVAAQLRLRDVPEIDDTVLDIQRRLDDALRRIAALLNQRAVLKQRLTLLAKTAATAHRFAYHDELTGLPNRRLLSDRFDRAAARGARGHHQIAAVFIDLDGFKPINDTLGHSMGDNLLQRVAERLVRCVRASDTVCRLGGDEFLVLLEEVDGEGALATAVKIRAQLSVPYRIGNSVIEITASVGAAVCERSGEPLDSLMRRADLAMYRDKTQRPDLAMYRDKTQRPTPPTFGEGRLHAPADPRWSDALRPACAAFAASVRSGRQRELYQQARTRPTAAREITPRSRRSTP